MSEILTLTQSEEARDALSEVLSGDLGGVEAAAELLRHELFARGLSTRRMACQRVQEHLGVFIDADKDAVRKVLDELERAGDVFSAPGGKVAPAPLRLVELSEKQYTVFGGIPGSRIRSELSDVELTGEGIQRWLSLGDSEREEFEGAVIAMGGLLLSPERWAGLDRILACGEEWLEEISGRFEFEKTGPGSHGDLPLEQWSVYCPDPSVPQQQRRWVRGGREGATGNLWRNRHAGGWWIYAWCEENSPAESDSLALRQDDALRTAYSLDAGKEATLGFLWRDGEEVELEVDAFLPLAEYRFLNLAGRQERREEGGYRYRFASEEWERVAEMLQERLRIELTEKSE